MNRNDLEWLRNNVETVLKYRTLMGHGVFAGALIRAASNEVLQTLLDLGVDPNKSYKHSTSFLFPILYNDERSFNFLMGIPNIDLNVTGRIWRLTPLMFAVTNGRPRMIEALIRAGCNLNARDEFGKTALMTSITAAFWDSPNGEVVSVSPIQLEILEILLRNGADPFVPDNFFRTPLAAAIENNWVEGVRTLLRYGTYRDRDESLRDRIKDCRNPTIRYMLERVQLMLTLSSARTVRRIGVRSSVRMLPLEIIRLIGDTI